MTNHLIRKMVMAAGCVLAGFASGPAHAGSVTYFTPSGSTTSGPVSASAAFTTSAGSLTITLSNLQANIQDVAQAISDLSFTVDSGSSLTGASMSSSSGTEVTVSNNGSFTTGSSVATGWVPTLSGTSGYLDVLQGPGHAGPTHLIIGGPDGSNVYSNANGSIAGNPAHNPFLFESATFTITGSGITANTTITAASFSFGTTEGKYVIDGTVPEPGSLVLGALGFGLMGAAGLYRKRRRACAVAE